MKVRNLFKILHYLLERCVDFSIFYFQFLATFSLFFWIKGIFDRMFFSFWIFLKKRIVRESNFLKLKKIYIFERTKNNLKFWRKRNIGRDNFWVFVFKKRKILREHLSQKTCAQLAKVAPTGPIKRSLHIEAETTPKCHPRVHQVSYGWHSYPTNHPPIKTLLNPNPNSLT